MVLAVPLIVLGVWWTGFFGPASFSKSFFLLDRQRNFLLQQFHSESIYRTCVHTCDCNFQGWLAVTVPVLRMECTMISTSFLKLVIFQIWHLYNLSIMSLSQLSPHVSFQDWEIQIYPSRSNSWNSNGGYMRAGTYRCILWVWGGESTMGITGRQSWWRVPKTWPGDNKTSQPAWTGWLPRSVLYWESVFTMLFSWQHLPWDFDTFFDLYQLQQSYEDEVAAKKCVLEQVMKLEQALQDTAVKSFNNEKQVWSSLQLTSANEVNCTTNQFVFWGLGVNCLQRMSRC